MGFQDPVSRRTFLKSAGLLVGALAVPWGVTSTVNAALGDTLPTGAAPQLGQGIQIGDVRADRAIIWSRADRPARLLVDYDVRAAFANPRRVRGPFALDTTDYTARVDLTGLPADSDIFVRVMFHDLSNDRLVREPVRGSFRTAPVKRRAIHFLWSGDTAGQGWGINPDVGGMTIYEAMRRIRPDFFIHCGDNIYADGPIQGAVTAEDGRVWRNLVTPEVAKVAETLAEFRGRYKYNLLDENVRRFNAEVPQIWQWDDHEVVNNWSDTKDLSADARYSEKHLPLLIARGARAFLEYAPLRYTGVEESERVYRYIPYGPLLDVFVLDMRSYRAGNSYNRQPAPGPDTAFLGARPEGVVATATARIPGGVESDRGRHAPGAPGRGRHGRRRAPALGKWRERGWPGLRPGVRNRRYSWLYQTPEDPERGVAHCRRPLLRGPLLRPAGGAVSGVRPVLGVRHRAAQRRHVWP